MCGISGILKYKNSATSDLDIALLLEGMNNTIKHRGPDDQGIWTHHILPVGISQVRLSILDLSEAGHQPMIDGLSGNTITYNGEVFNFREINESILSDQSFNSNTDTETILKLYNRYGSQALSYLNGMFAFAIWDNCKEHLFLARDRSGKKPLYYTERDGMFIFSSEIKSILSLPNFKRTLDVEAFYHFLTFGLLPEPYTMFQGINKIHPGHFMVVSSKGIIDYQKYWEPELANLKNISELELQTLVLSQLSKSVKQRMISDVPIGAFLSGGVDSSAIVALMRKNTDKSIKTFSIGFEGQPDYDELTEARKVSVMFGTDHYEKVVSRQDIIDFLPEIVNIFDEPIADPTLIPINFISQMAKTEGIKVVLNGDGADEIFAGYKKYLMYVKLEYYYKTWCKTPLSLRRTVARIVNNFQDVGHLNEFLFRSSRDQLFYWGHAGGFSENLKYKVLSSRIKNECATLTSYSIVEKLHNDYKAIFEPYYNDIINWMTYIGWRLADTNKYLFRSDRIGMAHSIETRSPFLDYKMIELAFSIPSTYKIKNNEPKYVLKKSLDSLLPESLLYRKKKGFNLPFREWAAETFLPWVESNIYNFNKLTDLYNVDAINAQIKLARNGDNLALNNIWIVYFLMNWYYKWLD